MHFTRICLTTLIAIILTSMIAACLACCGAAPVAEPLVELSAEEASPAELVARLYTGSVEPLAEERRAIYEGCIGALLEEDLWTERDMYDTCHRMMIPMYYAFYSGEEDFIARFASFFARFTEDITGPDTHSFLEAGTLNKLHFFYLCTQFMNLCQANGYGERIPEALPRIAQDFAADYLLNHESNWGLEPTVILRLENILAGKQYSKYFHRTIEDLDRFTLAILCDLKCLHIQRGEAYDEVLDTAADLAFRIFNDPALNVETEDGGWLFQPGAMRDHRDNAYAGNEAITEDIRPKTREDIVEDVSHFQRMPLHLRSWQSAQPSRTRWNLFALRRKQLANQLVNHVMRKVDGWWLCTTFMNGVNGVYRYTEGTGVEGWELSYSFLMGWWSLLGDERVTERYQDILEVCPLTGDLSNPYFNYYGKPFSGQGREQNPYYDRRNAFDNGMYECMIACAAALRP